MVHTRALSYKAPSSSLVLKSRTSKSSTCPSGQDVPVWTNELMEKINSLAIGGITVEMSHKFELLEELLDHLECPRFLYAKEQDVLAGKEAILALWVMILTRIDQISVLHYKHMCFRLISACMRREEFRLGNFPMDPVSNELSIPTNHLRLTKVYRQLVRDSFLYASKLLVSATESNSKKSGAKQRSTGTTSVVHKQTDGLDRNLGLMDGPEVFRFCARVISGAFFSFPSIQAPLVDIFCWSYGHAKASCGPISYEANESDSLNSDEHCNEVMENEITTVLEGCYPEASMAKFMELVPDIFQWNQLASPSDTKILPDDDTWRRILSSRGIAFITFFREFVQYVHLVVPAKRESYRSRSKVTRAQIPWRILPGYQQFLELFCYLLQDAMIWMSFGEDIEGTGPATSCDVDFCKAKERRLGENRSGKDNDAPEENSSADTESVDSAEEDSSATVDKPIDEQDPTCGEEKQKTNQKENRCSIKDTELRTSQSRKHNRTFYFHMNQMVCDETLELASILIQSNPSLIGVFSKLIFNGMNEENPGSISKAFHYLSKWMLLASNTPGLHEYMEATSLSPSQRLPLQSAKFPPSMDLTHLISVCLKLCRSKDSSVIVTTLAFLYNHLDGMGVESREKLVTSILQHNFFTFFLHWRFEVRCCFHHLLVFKVLRYDRRRLGLESDRHLLRALSTGLLDVKEAGETKEPVLVMHDETPSARSPPRSAANVPSDNLPSVCENPHMILDQAITSKLDVFLQIICEHRRGGGSHGTRSRSGSNLNLADPFPEECEIFLRTSIIEYAHVVRSYYGYCEEVEHMEGRQLRIHEAIEGPDLSAVLVKRSPVES